MSETHRGVLEGSGGSRIPGAAGARTRGTSEVVTIIIMRLRHPLRGRQRGRGAVIKEGAILKQSSSQHILPCPGDCASEPVISDGSIQTSPESII